MILHYVKLRNIKEKLFIEGILFLMYNTIMKY